MRYQPVPLRHRYACVRAHHVIQMGHVQKSIIRYTTATKRLHKTCHISLIVVTFLHPNLLPPTVTSRLSAR